MKKIGCIFLSVWLGFMMTSAVIPAHAGTLTDSNDQPQPLSLGVSIGSATSVHDLADYIALAYRYAIGIATICAIVMLVYGGFRYLVGSAMGDIAKGKTIIFGLPGNPVSVLVCFYEYVRMALRIFMGFENPSLPEGFYS